MIRTDLVKLINYTQPGVTVESVQLVDRAGVGVRIYWETSYAELYALGVSASFLRHFEEAYLAEARDQIEHGKLPIVLGED